MPSSILPELEPIEPKPFIWPNKPLAPLSEVQLEQQKQFLDTVKQSIVILPSTEERHLPFFVFEEPSGVIIKDVDNLKDKNVNLEDEKKKDYETTYETTAKDLFFKKFESSPKQLGPKQLGSKPFGFDD